MPVTAVLLSIIVILITAAIYHIKRRLSYWKELGIPHDVPNLLAGNFEGVMKTSTFAEIDKTTYLKFKGTGPFCGFYFFQRPGVMLLDLNLIKNVLIKDFSNFVNRGLFYNEVDDPLTAHLFFVEDQQWRNLRNKLSPTFTTGKMKYMFSEMLQISEQFVQMLGGMLTKGDVIEIKELLARFGTDVIGTCAFGIECNSLKDPNAEFRVMGRRAINEPRHENFISAFIEGFPRLARKLHMRVIDEDVHQFFMRIVREAVDYRTQNNVQRNDFLSLLIDINKGKKFGAAVSDELKGLTVEQMAAQAFVFFIAGFEATSTTMGFLLYELARHTEIQEKMRSEINGIYEKYNHQLTYQSLKEMEYMQQVIAETLRFYTIVPHLNRQALHDYEVPGYSNYIIRKGMPVLISSIGIHHDPDLYPQPEVFDPERFSAEKVQQRESVAYLPFGDGPRNCIGMRFGQMQMRIGLAYLLMKFKFSVCAQTEIPLSMNPRSLVVNSKHGIFLQVKVV